MQQVNLCGNIAPRLAADWKKLAMFFVFTASLAAFFSVFAFCRAGCECHNSR